MQNRILAAWLAAALCTSAPAAESSQVLPARRTDVPPVLDGQLSDDAWKTAPRAAGFTDIYLGTPPADQTEAWLCYDTNFIYVAFRAFDSQPDKIVAQETKEEAGLRGDDAVCLNLDPFHTHQGTERSLFVVSANGSHVAYIGAGRAVKTEWKGEWKSAAQITTNGWTAEMAIPWAMLSYPIGHRPVTMGLNFSRIQQRTQVISFWANIGTRSNYELDGHWEGVVPPPFKPRFSYLPYVLGQVGGSAKGTAGLDVRAALTPTLTGVFTANPDFGTVERAVEGIDFSYSERFVPDQRPFFMEGENFYTEGTLIGRFFHSLRIPDFDAGLNFYGRVGPRTSAGVLGAFELDGRQDYVVRARQEFNTTDSLAVSAVGRNDSDGDNEVLVFHPAWRRANWVGLLHWAPSFTDGEYSGDALNFDLVYQTQRTSAGGVVHYVRPEFRADNGYIPFTDEYGLFAYVGHTTEWRAGPLRRLRLYPMTRLANHFDGRPFRRMATFYLFSETRGDWGIDLRVEAGRFERYDDRLFEIKVRGRVSDKFHNFGLGVQWGRQGGEDLLFLTPSIHWRFAERFSVGAASSVLSHRQDRFQHLLSLSYDLTKAWSFGGRLVWQDELTSGFLSLRRSGYAGTDYYVVFGNPNPTAEFEPMLTLKIVMPF
ncbi:MAG: carbohydrate binding family 9 domain-containing protein [Verrucomicrobia bacterium]|nr:carbohydrate binding family 9 domain-containing protein [Verrucomicrobiota bacterium]